MQMNDSQRIPATKEKVWAALNDPAVLKQCIPGCQSLEMTSPTEMIATVVLKVGPVKATFGGKVTLSDLDPPNSYRITGEGADAAAIDRVKAPAGLDLGAITPEEIAMSILAEITIERRRGQRESTSRSQNKHADE